MTRARFVCVATLVAGGLAASTAVAQGAQAPAAPAPAVQAPALTPILTGKKFTPPIRGEADVEFINPVPKRDKDTVVIRIDVKNTSKAPIARLTIDETWYDKGGAVIAGGKGVINGLLQPGEIKTITIEMPYNAKLANDKMQFTHANGTVKQHRVAKLVAADAKEPAKKK